MQGITPEQIQGEYETLMSDFSTSKQAAEGALEEGKERAKQDYKFNGDEYKHIEYYYNKILKLNKLSLDMLYFYNTIGKEQFKQLRDKWNKEFESYQDEAEVNGIYEAYYEYRPSDPPLMLRRGGGKTKKKRKQRSNKSKKKRKRRRGNKSNKRRTRKY